MQAPSVQRDVSDGRANGALAYRIHAALWVN